MRLISWLLPLALLFSCSKDDQCGDPASLNYDRSEECVYADSTQHAIFFKFTGTWCPPCGSRAAVKMRNTLADNPGTIGIEVHYNDEMKSDVGYKFITHFGIGAFPRFRINNDEVFLLEHALEKTPEVGMHLEHRVKDEKIHVSGMAKALSDLEGPEYNIAIYLLEDGYVAPQYADDHSAFPEWEYRNGRYPNYIHKRILRAELSGNTFGRLLHTGSWNKGEILPFEAEMDIPEEIEGEVYVVAVIWRRENRMSHFVNAFRS